MSGDIDMDGNEITGLGDPVQNNEASNKKYVDDSIKGLSHIVLHKVGGLKADYVLKTGDTLTGNLNMNNNKIKNIAAPIDSDDATSKAWVESKIASIPSGSGSGSTDLPLAGGTMTGDINMAGNKIEGSGDLTNINDAARKKYVDDSVSGMSHLVLHKIGGTMLGNLNMNDELIKNLGTPVDDKDPVGKGWVESKIASIPSRGGSGFSGLSASGFTMTGNINMNDNRITDVATPINIVT